MTDSNHSDSVKVDYFHAASHSVECQQCDATIPIGAIYCTVLPELAQVSVSICAGCALDTFSHLLDHSMLPMLQMAADTAALSE